ncbi:MAG: hypothetical protein RBT16_04655 [Desulfococcus multivorans]|nr:hypothetical protein [Desulfococcus multivorans]
MRRCISSRSAGTSSCSAFLVPRDQNAEGHICLSPGLPPQRGKGILEQHKRQGYGVFVVYGASTVKHSILFNRHEQGIRAVDDIEMGHQKDFCAPGMGQRPDGGDARHVLPVVNNVVSVEPGLDISGATMKFIRIGRACFETD